jgi:3-oxoacyl-(acyl-carrier-protein) synthase
VGSGHNLQSDVGSFETVRCRRSRRALERAASGQRATSDRITLYALIAAESALRDAVLDPTNEDRTRIGVSVGTSLVERLAKRRPTPISSVRGKVG